MTPLLTRRRLLGLGLAGATLLAAGCTVRARATPDGSFDDARRAFDEGVAVAREGYSFFELDWRDAGRDRAVPVRLYLPGSSDAALPLVLFSHGLGGSRRGYSYLGAHFARSGIASLHVQHVGSDRGVWVGGSAWEVTSRLQAAARETEALDRVVDLRFALDRVLQAGADDAWRFRPATDRIVVAGHSYGANTAMLASGAQVERDGRPVDLRDPRLAAALLLSAPPFYGEPDLGQVLRHVTLPSLHVTNTDDEIRVPGYFSPAADRVAVFDAIGSRPKALAIYAGGGHSIFTDRTGPGGAELNARVKLATRELAVAFLASTFDGQAAELAQWRERHRDILARFTRDPALA